ncbi:hypothetical protein [Streptomyces sp. NPDC101393]|uniref:hypothetical protein n=1 Tax=Streptomyces sp. NPDC101393 TaxID=3366141 RepID=UPI00380ED136
MEFLYREAEGQALPSAWLDFDPRFNDPFTAPRTRERLYRRHGVDIGFDPGAEGFSAMWALALLPPADQESHELIAILARQVERCRRGDRYRFFPSSTAFACDTDCTAVAAVALHRHGLLPRARLTAAAREVLHAGANGVGPHPGVVTVYWDDHAEAQALPRKRRHDAVACANVLHLLGLAQQDTHLEGLHAAATLRYVGDHLTSGRYLLGSRYYPAPAAFLHAASRLCTGETAVASVLRAPLHDAVLQHLAVQPSPPTNALDLALLILAAENLGIAAGQRERRTLLAGAQRPDGSWPACPYFRMGRFTLYFGSPHLTTLFALSALSPQRGCP